MQQEHSHVLSALRRKRADVSGKIEHLTVEARTLQAELDHLDATIRIFDPDADLGEIKDRLYPPRHRGVKGEMIGHLYDALREATTPLSSAELSDRVMVARGLNPEDRGLRQIMRRRVIASLGDLRRKEVAKSEPAADGLLVWSFIPRGGDDD